MQVPWGGPSALTPEPRPGVNSLHPSRHSSSQNPGDLSVSRHPTNWGAWGGCGTSKVCPCFPPPQDAGRRL